MCSKKLPYKNGYNGSVAIEFIQEMGKRELLVFICEIKKTRVSSYKEPQSCQMEWITSGTYKYIFIASTLEEYKVNMKVNVNITQYFAFFCAIVWTITMSKSNNKYVPNIYTKHALYCRKTIYAQINKHKEGGIAESIKISNVILPI